MAPHWDKFELCLDSVKTKVIAEWTIQCTSYLPSHPKTLSFTFPFQVHQNVPQNVPPVHPLGSTPTARSLIQATILFSSGTEDSQVLSLCFPTICSPPNELLKSQITHLPPVQSPPVASQPEEDPCPRPLNEVVHPFHLCFRIASQPIHAFPLLQPCQRTLLFSQNTLAPQGV